MPINYTSKVNERPIGQELHILGENHTIGVVGVSTVEANMIKLIEVPLQSTPTSTVSIPGYAETTNPIPGVGLFYVDYVNGYVTFQSFPDINGTPVAVTYYGRGSEIDAVDINEIQQPVGVAMDLDGTLTPNGVIFGVISVTNPASITVSQVDNHTGLVVIASTTVNVTIPPPTDTTEGRFFSVLNSSTSIQNITVNGNTIVIGYGATWLWDGFAWLLVSPIPAVNGIAIVSSDPPSPFTGQVWFNSTTMQFIGYNGSAKIVIG
jgi:hypothetical protein